LNDLRVTLHAESPRLRLDWPRPLRGGPARNGAELLEIRHRAARVTHTPAATQKI